jgi:asparagine synthase (glutamine-hydrolysing)
MYRWEFFPCLVAKLRVALLFSGGKDSAYAGWVVYHQGWQIETLVTVRPNSPDSWMFHYPNVEWTHLQAHAMNIPQRIVNYSGENELQALERDLGKAKQEYALQGLVTGAVASDFQKSRIDTICDSVELKSYSPIWHKQPRIIIDDLRQADFHIILTKVAANGLDKSWLGKELNRNDWDKLLDFSARYGFNPVGEGGEYETFVLDAPHFKKRIEIEKGTVSTMGDSATFTIQKASLREKL